MANETDFIDDVIETEELTTSDRLLDEEVLEHEDRFAQSEVEASARSNSTASRISNFSKRSSQASIKSRRAYGIDASFEEAPEDATNHPEVMPKKILFTSAVFLLTRLYFASVICMQLRHKY